MLLVYMMLLKMFLQIVLSRFSHSNWTFKAQERPKYCKLCELILYDLLNSPFGRTICLLFDVKCYFSLVDVSPLSPILSSIVAQLALKHSQMV